MRRTPLPWLAALLLAYLVIPVAAFLVRVPGTDWKQAAAPGVGTALWLSVYSSTIATLVIVVLGVPLGYVLARSHSRITRVISVLVQLPLALPPLISGILLIYLVGPYTALGRLFGQSLTDSVTGIVLAEVFVAAPFLVVSARSAFEAMDPGVEEVAATLGHGRLARFLIVALPSASGGVRAGILLSWLRAFGEFGATIVLAYNPNALPVFIYVQFSGSGLPGTTIPVLLTLAAALVVLLLAERSAGGRRRLLGRRRPATLPEPRSPSVVAGPLLDLDVTARLDGFRLAVRHTARARRLAILGPSGAGKSTTLRVVAGLLHPDSGHLHADGEDLLALPVERRDIGYLPQESLLLPRARLERQITFGVGSDPAVASYWAHRLGIEHLLDRRPDQLSGGQRRRAAIARALAREPRILLLDEPLTGLDTPVREDLRRLLRTITAETRLTTLLVTHDPLEAAMLADEVLVVIDGTVRQAGPQREVFARPADPQVARLLGVRNVRSTAVVRDGVLTDGDLRVPVPSTVPDGPAAWCVRPEDVLLTTDAAASVSVLESVSAPDTDAATSGAAAEPDGGPSAAVPSNGGRPAAMPEAGAGTPAVVRDVLHLGGVAEAVAVTRAGTELSARLSEDRTPEPGETVRITVRPAGVTTWPITPDAVTAPRVPAG
jgi:molybdate transport system ATP-binding protein/molybdate transport system permease protein